MKPRYNGVYTHYNLVAQIGRLDVYVRKADAPAAEWFSAGVEWGLKLSETIFDSTITGILDARGFPPAAQQERDQIAAVLALMGVPE